MKTTKTNETTATTTAPSISLTALSPTQLKELRAMLREQGSKTRGNVTKRNAVIDRMLHERDDTGFKHTTADILAALQSGGIVASNLSSEDRAAALKMIQTRKQTLANKGDDKVGYKPTPTGIGALTVERAIAYLNEAGYVVTKK